MKRLLSTLFCLLLVVTAFAQRPYTMIQNGQKQTFTASELKDFVQKSMREKMKGINEQLPLHIDEFTTLYSVLYIGTTVNYCYKVDLDVSDYTQEEINQVISEIKETCKENFIFLFRSGSNMMPAKEWKRLFTELGIYYTYYYYDCNNKVFARFSIYPKDVDLDKNK